jgi:hypothetical protein
VILMPHWANQSRKDPESWITGGEPATQGQINYLKSIAAQSKTEVETKNLTKAEAAKKIESLQRFMHSR